MESHKTTQSATQANTATTELVTQTNMANTESNTQANMATSSTAPANAAAPHNPTPCHICARMRARRPAHVAVLMGRWAGEVVEGKHAHLETQGPVRDCILCARKYCEEHKGKDEGVCEINHQTYWDNHKRRVPEGTIFSSLWHLEGYKRIKQLEADGEL
ncbi:hypothetical protein GGTG_12312 [Gaeumannomyces tritici R3-111a-1]|uniref:Uncharacterized protein n=1 Tax=Gaeumannomyces tritici (strain R3-111a-1) TaxID=644352 RepID=J3PFN7_GAET3|nr:hypothetical protein GGTG_12312 [Gaeumannomyces tritici R3-111a-1]EJT70139.1 hypothetical protein GGTG_12312 [Gaeumannomyces tritici R3-111a-1]